MSDNDEALSEEIVMALFGGLDDHHSPADEDARGWEAETHLVQFADAIFYVHPHWLQPMIMTPDATRRLRRCHDGDRQG